MLAPTLDSVRLFLHVLAACIWVGGQFVLVGLVPGLRKVGPEATKAAANGFALVAWPAFGVLWVTGIWNVLETPGSASTAYNITFGVKILLVVAAGISAFFHSRTEKRPIMAITGAIGGILAPLTLFLGILLANGA